MKPFRFQTGSQRGNTGQRSAVPCNQSGTVLILAAFLIVFLAALSALVVDIGHLAVVRNQVQNAADAGALAGARRLYTSISGTRFFVNPEANEIASAATTTNRSDNTAVEAGPASVVKGHWCFSCSGPNGEKGVFTPNDSVTTFSLDSISFADLDTNTDFINAVRVSASRGPERPAASFFARIFGYDGFPVNADAVAWIGCAGENFKVDHPLAICRQSMIGSDGKENCTGGKLINSNEETGAWTNLEQGESACEGASSTTEVRPLICAGGPINREVRAGQPMTLVNGELQSVFSDFRACWKNNGLLDSNGDSVPDRVWNMLLPMIDCSDESPVCKTLLGAIDVEVFWITPNGSDPHFNGIPTAFDVDPGAAGMEYTCPQTCPEEPCSSLSTEEGRKRCWLDFLDHFNVRDENGNAYTPEAPGYTPNTVYFKPKCSFKQMGTSGGAPSNVIAEIPKLVQ